MPGPTNFPSGLASFGIPVLGGACGVPYTGNYWFVKPSSGLDGNSGKTPRRALKTIAEALDRATANNNDVIVLIGESNTAASTTDYQSTSLVWNKDLTHLVGVAAPGAFSHRARIAQLSTATGVTQLVSVTANACHFANLSIFHGVADATSLVALKVTGARNVFENMHIAGMGDTNKVQSVTGAASLWLSAASENLFRHCTIGLDTAVRDADGTEILCASSASRNVFEDCLIDSYIDAATFCSVTIGATGIDRGLYFKNCLFMAKSTNKATTQTSVFSIPAISQGAIVLQNSYAFSDGGAVDWDSNNRGIIWNNSVAAAASAAGGIMTNQ